MLKRFAYLAAGLLLCGAAMNVYAADAEPVEPGLLTISSQMQDINTQPIVISHIIYRGYSPIFTTTTLTLFQDEKGKLQGTAKFESSEPAKGKPEVALPYTFNVAGKIKGSNFTLKAKSKIAGGADYHSRNLSFGLSASMVDFVQANPHAHDFKSTATYQVNTQVSGFGYDYNFTALAKNVGDYYFMFQPLSAAEALDYKQPKNGRLYKIWTAWGPTVVTGTTSSNAPGELTLTLKGKKFLYVGTDFDNWGDYFYPETYYLKTGYGTETFDNIWDRILLVTFNIYDGGVINL